MSPAQDVQKVSELLTYNEIIPQFKLKTAVGTVTSCRAYLDEFLTVDIIEE
jgi:hypothetical protein